MAFRNLTNSGKAYLATRLANELPVKFTKAKIGNGGVPTSTDPAQTTELYGFKKQVTILKAVQEQNSIKLTIQITNDGINEGFYLKEIGIYVDDNGREVLYWYCNEDNSQYINAQTDTPLSFEVDIMMEVTNINSTIVEWTGKDTWVNKTLLNEELAKKIDKGAVSSEYDTAKKIEDKIKVAQSTADSKLDKGNVLEKYNTTEKIGNNINGILNKIQDYTFYSHYKQLGLSQGCSVNDIYKKMPSNSVFIMYTETNIPDFKVLQVPQSGGLLIIYKFLYYRGHIEFLGGGNLIFYGQTSSNEFQGEWLEQLSSYSQIFYRALGLEVYGFIQDVGTKEKDKGYIDNVTKKLYRAKETNSDTSVTNKFILATSVENSKTILSENKLQTSDYTIYIIEYQSEYVITGRLNRSYGDGETIVNVANYIPNAKMQDELEWLPALSVINDTRNIQPIVLVNKHGSLKYGDITTIYSTSNQTISFQIFVPKK